MGKDIGPKEKALREQREAAWAQRQAAAKKTAAPVKKATKARRKR